MFESLSDREECLARQIVDIAVKIHVELGPGLLERYTQNVSTTS